MMTAYPCGKTKSEKAKCKAIWNYLDKRLPEKDGSLRALFLSYDVERNKRTLSLFIGALTCWAHDNSYSVRFGPRNTGMIEFDGKILSNMTGSKILVIFEKCFAA